MMGSLDARGKAFPPSAPVLERVDLAKVEAFIEDPSVSAWEAFLVLTRETETAGRRWRTAEVDPVDGKVTFWYPSS